MSGPDMGNMELWFSEPHTKNVKLSIKIEKQIYCEKSKFQRIDIFDTVEFGKILVLDGYLMLTEKDEFIYHEMITHVPMAVHPDVQRVLVIGAGDGGTIRELTRYDQITQIDMVEIDEMVVTACREYLPQTASKLSDPRLNIIYADGLKYVRTQQDYYDLIIVDSTDPFGPGEGLFTREFYGNCFRALKEDGILINQHESPFYAEDALSMQRAHRNIAASFPIAKVYQFHLPTYPSGHWFFGFASKKYDPLADLNAEAWNQKGIETRYYNTDLHRGAFYIPNYVKELLGDA